jgi:hypothetical protein
MGRVGGAAVLRGGLEWRKGVEGLETRKGMGSRGGVQGRGMGGGGKCVWAFIYWGWKGFGRGEMKSAAEKFFYYFNVLWLIWDKKKML